MTDWDAELDILLTEMEQAEQRRAELSVAERGLDAAFARRLREYMARYRTILERLEEEQR